MAPSKAARLTPPIRSRFFSNFGEDPFTEKEEETEGSKSISPTKEAHGSARVRADVVAKVMKSVGQNVRPAAAGKTTPVTPALTKLAENTRPITSYFPPNEVIVQRTCLTWPCKKAEVSHPTYASTNSRSLRSSNDIERRDDKWTATNSG